MRIWLYFLIYKLFADSAKLIQVCLIFADIQHRESTPSCIGFDPGVLPTILKTFDWLCVSFQSVIS